jgi:hypothetical protein
MEDDLEQLHAYVMRTQRSIEFWQLEDHAANSSWFDIAKEMLEPLTKFSQLTTSLYETNPSKLNDDHLKILAIWERVIAVAFCFIHWFTRLDDESNGKNDLTYKFCYYASYELHTPFNLLRGYSNLLKNVATGQLKSEMAEQFVKGVLSPPFIPEHEDTLMQIDHWIEQLWKFKELVTTKIVKGRNDES